MPPETPAAALAASHAVELNVDGFSWPPRSEVNSSAAVTGWPCLRLPGSCHGRVTGRGGCRSMCADSASATGPGSGTSRSRPPFGDANHQRPPCGFTWRRTCTARRRKSTSSGPIPNVSPWRKPSPAPQSTIACHRGGSAARTAATSPPVHGVTLRRTGRGRFTDAERHGFRSISPSSTAAASTALRVMNTWPAVPGASFSDAMNWPTMDGRCASWPSA